MKPSILLFSSFIALTASAQTSSIFSVTDQVKGGANWSAIRSGFEGTSQKLLLNNFLAKGTAIDAVLQQKKVTYSPTAANAVDQPMFSGVAALAYDQKHERLYYATMFTQQLRYVDLASMNDHYYQAGDFSTVSRTKTVVSPQEQGPVVTRMTIGSDGYGYAISNDGNNFYRFSLDNKTTIESVGALVDDEKNASISVHNFCSSWGGDMVASAQGDLYLFTMRQLVFKIDPQTRIATYLGKINGLSDAFTINGAAVDESGKVILSTASYAGSRGVVDDMLKLTATEEKNESFFNASDLASCNFLFANLAEKQPLVVSKKMDRISMYPNPVTDGFTLLSFDKNITGKLQINVVNGAGSSMLQQNVQVNSEGQQVRLSTRRLAKGLYVVKVTDAASKEVYASKLLVQ